MQFDEFLVIIGEFGYYQKRTYFLLCLTSILAGFHMLNSVILLGVPKHRCKIPGLPNDTYAIQNEEHRRLINFSIPVKSSGDSTVTYEKCDVYLLNATGNKHVRTDKVSCDSWVYDETVYKSTFASETNLVCDKSLWTANGSMVFFVGVLIGSFFLGWLSDIIGRKKTLCISLLLLLLSSMGVAWAPEFYSFCVLRFFVGVSCIGIVMSSFIIGMETVGPSKRVWTGMIIKYFFPTGLMVLTLLAYTIRDWKYVEIAGSAPVVLYLSYWWIIPESPRWLLNRGRIEEAKEILRRIAKGNKTTVTEKQLDELKSDPSKTSGKLWQLFSTWVLFYRALIVFFNWMVVSMVYYGLSLSTRNLSGDLYLNLFLSALVEFPAYTICIILLNRVGRKILHAFFMIFGGIACVLTILTFIYLEEDLQPITVTLAMLGKVGAAAAFAVIYTWTAELFPTDVRNAGLGASSASARIGGIISPYIADLNKVIEGDIGKATPMVIFGGVSILAGILSLLLPETLNTNLPETIEDTKKLGMKGQQYVEEEQKKGENRNETDMQTRL